MSGPYALGAFGDAVYYGNVNLGATVSRPSLLAASYQKAYGNLYAQPSDCFEAAYATGIEQLLPSATPLASAGGPGQAPQTQLFSSTPPAPAFAAITPPTQPPALAPLFALGFGRNRTWSRTAPAWLTCRMPPPIPTAPCPMPPPAPGGRTAASAAQGLQGQRSAQLEAPAPGAAVRRQCRPDGVLAPTPR